MITDLRADWISRTGSQIDRIRINSLERQVVDGVSVWVKRRTTSSYFLVPVANLFFILAGNPVRVFPTDEEWQKREVELFRGLNGAQAKAGIFDRNAMYAEVLPGRNLVELLEQGLLQPEIMTLVGAAFFKMHQRIFPNYERRFSHGDPHLGNIIYDATKEEVGWIDFETEHRAALSDDERHADDLLVFLLDLAGRTNEEQWVGLSTALLAGYPNTRVLGCVKKRLQLPIGMGAIWWAVRTSYLARRILEERIHGLRKRL